jgi:transcriptional regulator PpsR
LLNHQQPGMRAGSSDSGFIANLIAASSDIAFVVEADGVIADLSLGGHMDGESLNSYIGQRWVDLVANESKPKVEQMLLDAIGGKKPRPREINHTLLSGGELPTQFSAVHVGPDGRVLALGRDLRPIAKLQQKVIDLQRSAEREFARVRNAETRYRMLFQLSSEPLVVVEGANTRVTEINAAAADLFGRPAAKITGSNFRDLFDAESATRLVDLIQTARVAGRADGAARLRLTDDDIELSASASSFRSESTVHVLVRLTPVTGVPEGSATKLPVMEILRKIPEAFVVIDHERRILEANESFLELAELASVEQVRGQRLDRWVGRPGVDVDLIVSNLREHSSIRDFSTIVRGEHQGQEEVEVSGVAAMHGASPCYGLAIRVIRQRAAISLPRGATNFPSAVTNLAELVGRVSLKELVRETTDMVEQMCIEAALELTNDNRASAAQILGLSRQGLYAKLRRYGIDDDAEGEDETSAPKS